MVDPHRPGDLLRADRGVGTECDQLDRLVVGKPELDVFVPGGKTREPRGADGPGLCRPGTGGHVDHGHASPRGRGLSDRRSEEHTSELQSLMRISYAVFCLKKK